jgi:DNA-binding transcriptional LysR family regulator
MLDELNELKTFRAILAEGSLSTAARRLGVTLAVVSKRLTTLENRVGLRLVHRTTRSLSPTEEGSGSRIECPAGRLYSRTLTIVLPT